MRIAIALLGLSILPVWAQFPASLQEFPPMPGEAASKLMYGDNAGCLYDLKIAAEAGDVAGMLWMGAANSEMEQFGYDFAEAVKWYTKAADKGSGLAAHRLGLLYLRLAPPNREEAARWFKRAEELGYTAPKPVG